jgi:methylase of polypeptide subunit release factors
MIRLRLPQMPERLGRHTLSLPEGVRPTVEDCLASGTLLLEQAGIETARLDAECLLAKILGWPRFQVILDQKRRLTPRQFGQYLRLLQRREQREPLAYLLGVREFWSLALSVSPGVLIPRPETESLVEAAMSVCRALDSRESTPAQAPGPSEGAGTQAGSPAPPGGLSIVDLCTGSGAVAIALAREFPGARVFATDSSWRALRVARANAEAHGVADRVVVLRGCGRGESALRAVGDDPDADARSAVGAPGGAGRRTGRPAGASRDHPDHPPASSGGRISPPGDRCGPGGGGHPAHASHRLLREPAGSPGSGGTRPRRRGTTPRQWRMKYRLALDRGRIWTS